jgi:integrase
VGRKRISGLYKRQGVWHIDKQIFGKRVCESTGTDSFEVAEKFLVHRIEELRNASIFGIRPQRTFYQAATKFLLENQHKATIKDDAGRLKPLVGLIGDLPLESVHMGTLQPFIEARLKSGVKTKTISHALQVVRRILNLATSEWVDENGLSWLHSAPKIKLLKETDSRPSYPLNWEEQDRLFQELPEHLRKMTLFAVNTGCRDAVICHLRWEWESSLENGRSVFVVPGEFVKNREDSLVVLNDVAQSIINSVRGQHPEFVFTYKGNPIGRINNTGWKKARKRAGLSNVRVHDLKHTFGRRLRAAGVSFEDRQDLLGHKSSRITTHYSSAELENLIRAANSVRHRENCGTLLRVVKLDKKSRKSPASFLRVV